MSTALSEFGANLSKALEARRAKIKPVPQSDRAEINQPVVPTDAAQTTDANQAAAFDRAAASYTASGMLDRIQSVTGPLRAYDGRYCVWGSNGPFDVRDIANRIGVTMHDVVENLPEFKPAKRGKRGDDDDSTQGD